MNFYSIKLVILLFFTMTITPVFADYYDKAIAVSVISDDRGRLDKYPVSSTHNKEKAYIMATKGQSYGIRIRNKTANRIGVVIAVDGRNIISGKKSHLSKKERMYILDPFEVSIYKGWRTGRKQVNRFYFTKEKHSYADSWGDHSAMGVISVAAFEEKKRHYRKPQKKLSTSNRSRRSSKQAGTGFGEEEYSPTTSVYFKPRNKPSFKSFLKYEWKQVLCKKGIINCHRKHYRPKRYNRFWDNDDDFAPYPGQYRNWRRDF